MKNTLRITIVLIIAGIWGCSESDPVCPDSQSYDFKLLLTQISDSTSTRLKIYHPDIDSLNAEEIFPEIVSIPVNVKADTTYFFIDFINDTAPEYNSTDTIMFTHTDSLYLNYQECGFIEAFTVQDIYLTNNHIDSAYWYNDKINEDNDGNLEIFY